MAQEIAKPNIVLILADDLGWRDVGYNGAEFYETPHIDKLAQEGIILDRFYPGAANCAPTRASILTGMYTPRTRVYLPQGPARGGAIDKMRFKVPTQNADKSFNTFPISRNQVDGGYTSLAEMLKEGGYVSGRFGKWHIGDDNQGFDVNSAAGNIGEVFNTTGTEKRFYNDVGVAERLTDAAIEFIKAHKKQAFFLYLAHWEVHTPITAREERVKYFVQKKKRFDTPSLNPTYAAEIEQVDISVGRIMEALEKQGLAENTLVIFTSDNGGLSKVTNNAPLRAGKGTFYEGGIRTPFCAKWPKVIPAGSRSDIPVNGVDFMPTFAEIAQTPYPSGQAVDGISILPILRNEDFYSNRALFFHFPLYLGSGGKDNVLPAYQGPDNYWRAVPSTTVIRGDWKLIFYYEYERFELFNLKEDISEQHNVATENPWRAQEFMMDLAAWIKEVGAPIPQVENDQFVPSDKE